MTLCPPYFTAPNDSLCCPDFIPTELQCKMSGYYGWLYNILLDIQTKAANAEYFGQADKSLELYNCINDYHYLFLYFMTIYKQRQIDAALDEVCGYDKGNAYYIEFYNIACIRKYFMCRNINISNLLELFGLNSANDTLQGIGSMSIEEVVDPGCNDDNIFTIS